MSRFARWNSSNSVVSALLLGVLMLRALIPAGYMPGTGEGLLVPLQLCTVRGLETLPRSDGGQAPAPIPASHDEAPCPFAAWAPAAPLAAQWQFVDRPWQAGTVPPNDTVSPVQPSILRTQSPRAPPASS